MVPNFITNKSERKIFPHVKLVAKTYKCWDGGRAVTLLGIVGLV